MNISQAFNVKIHGNGDNTIVFSHGFGTTQKAWGPVVERLQDHYRIVTFDLAGADAKTIAAFNSQRHGSLDGFAEDITVILDDLDATDIVFVGHSVSGMLAVLTANADPDRFKGLVLVAPSARYMDDPEDGYVGGFPREAIDGVIAAAGQDFGAWANGFSQMVMANPEEPDLAADFNKSLQALRPDIALATLKAIFYSDHREDARKAGGLGIPIRIIQPGNEVAVPRAAADWLANATGAELRVLPDLSGHFPHIIAPDAVAGEIRDFLTRHGW